MIVDADTRGGGFKGFKGLCKAIGGKKLVFFYTMMLCFAIYGSMTGYQIIIASMIQRIMQNAGVEDYDSYRNYHVILLSICVIFPITLLKGVNRLRYATILSITSISYTTIIAIVELPFYWVNGIADIDKLTLFRLDWTFFSAFGITFFAFLSQTGFYSAIEQLTKRDDAHLRTVI